MSKDLKHTARLQIVKCGIISAFAVCLTFAVFAYSALFLTQDILLLLFYKAAERQSRLLALLLGALSLCIPVAALMFYGASRFSFSVLFLNTAKNGKAKVSDFFNTFAIGSKSIKLYLLKDLLVFMWSLLLIVPGCVKAISYAMAPFILAENANLNARQALAESKKMMDGHKGEYFDLVLSFSPWFLLSFISFGIASLYVFPYFRLACVDFYIKLKYGESSEFKRLES